MAIDPSQLGFDGTKVFNVTKNSFHCNTKMGIHWRNYIYKNDVGLKIIKLSITDFQKTSL